jgi:hypothetical protein
MSKRQFSYTLIKRGHLVLQFGVGSVIRTRQGLTAVVAGLPEWHYKLAESVNGDAERDKYVKQSSFREAELTAATGITRFLPPPALTDNGRNWELPLLRFPMAGVCTNWQCRRVTYADHGARLSRNWRCPYCKGGKQLIQQVPFFLACPKGHLDEITWSDVVDHADGCTSNEVTVSLRGRADGATVKCLQCDQQGVTGDMPCTGARPWLPLLDSEQCDDRMRVVSRASVKAYFANTKSAIHIPLAAELDVELLEWLDRTNWAEGRRLETPEDRNIAADALRRLGWQVDAESTAAHISHLQTDQPTMAEHWDLLDARSREFEVLSGRRSYPALASSTLISLEHHPLEEFVHPLIGPDKPIVGVTAVHRLTESRTLNGFSRIEPRAVTPREGRLLMWGRDTTAEDWLPGYRTSGEGIFITFNPTLFAHSGATEDPAGWEAFRLSPAGVAAHTLAHLLINHLAEDSGYSAASIRDRIYDLPNGDVGVMVYTAEGDEMGTLGGLVAFSRPGTFERLLDAALDSAAWCAQDPVCSESSLDQKRGIHAACHQCVLLPETSCELFNARLDRRRVLSAFAPPLSS